MVGSMQGIDIKLVDEHYEAFCNGEFLVSGDTLEEVVRELYEMEEKDA